MQPAVTAKANIHNPTIANTYIYKFAYKIRLAEFGFLRAMKAD